MQYVPNGGLSYYYCCLYLLSDRLDELKYYFEESAECRGVCGCQIQDEAELRVWLLSLKTRTGIYKVLLLKQQKK